MMHQDTNFDDLAAHFQQRIYGSRKGRIRLAVLSRDLREQVPDLKQRKLQILGIGAGMAKLDIGFAVDGHKVMVNDISHAMLCLAKEEAKQYQVEQQISWSHGAFQHLTIPETEQQKFDLVLAHAVLEWLAKPQDLIMRLDQLVKKDGVVSLMFYNFDALVFHNLLRGNFRKLRKHNLSGMKGGLTPPNPLKPAWVEKSLQEHGFDVTYKSGVRVFSDYVGVRRGGNEQDEDVMHMELHYSNLDPYLHMGRYMHFICRRRG